MITNYCFAYRFLFKVPYSQSMSTQVLTAKANAPLMFRSRSPVNQTPLRSRSDITFLW